MEFFLMGGYARYVWSAFGVSFVVLLAVLWLTRRNFVLTKHLLLQRLRSTEGTQK